VDDLTLERVAPAAATDHDLIAGVVALVNGAYDAAEGGLWHIPIGRTNPDEVHRWFAAGHVVIARALGRVVGSVTSHLIDPVTGWFGALAVDPLLAGRGIASALVRHAEVDAAMAGATSMQLEVLEPDPPQDHQLRLRSWYAAIGYRPTGQLDLSEFDADSVPHARFPIHLVVMHKTLTAASPNEG
jgi:GNAT superfamily N-acetyltransferase